MNPATPSKLRLPPLQLAWLQELGVDAALLKPHAAPQAHAPRAQGYVHHAPPTTASDQDARATMRALLQGLNQKRNAGKTVIQPQEDAPRVTLAPSTQPALPLHATTLGCQLARSVRTDVTPDMATTTPWLVLCETSRGNTHPGLLQGRAATLLHAMLAAIGLELTDAVHRAQVALPASNTQTLAPALQQAIQQLHPTRILALGSVPATALLGSTQTLETLRGKLWSYTDATGRSVPVFVTYPPGWLLAHPQHKASAWRDLLLACAIPQENPPESGVPATNTV